MSFDDDRTAGSNRDFLKVDRRRRPERRLEILRAVMTLLEQGNRRVTTAELASQVGLSEAALYRHFSGKDAIFQALTDYLKDHLFQFAGRIPEVSSPLARLRLLLAYHLQFFTEHPGLCRVFLVEGVMTPAESQVMSRVVREYVRLIKSILNDARAARELPDSLDLDASADFFVGLIQAATLRFVISGFAVAPTTDVDSSWAFFVRGVGGVEKHV
ncbi:MAG: TetR family transcriptional regulator [Magnetococcales bacterium]|nr:TetR family transcriptional regulator [Magnetococcales bacterium]